MCLPPVSPRAHAPLTIPPPANHTQPPTTKQVPAPARLHALADIMGAALEGGAAAHEAVPCLAVALACDQLRVSCFSFFAVPALRRFALSPSPFRPPAPAADALFVTHNEAAPAAADEPHSLITNLFSGFL